MPACALCENVQPSGDACDVCGHPFPAGERVEPVVEPLPDLEPTLQLPVEADGELVDGLEATAIGPVQVVADTVEGLMPTAAEGLPDDGPAGEPVVSICRYCRTPAFPGEAFCGHCGMRLPAVGGGVAPPMEVVLCRDCGTPVRGETCPACGVRAQR
jgi:RNA polymerase subunit RPABC4/transcription elongation factor Spt4